MFKNAQYSGSSILLVEMKVRVKDVGVTAKAFAVASSYDVNKQLGIKRPQE